MKKALSIVLILTMLASLLVAAIPASARDEAVQMDTPWTTEEGWTAINNAAGLKNMANNGKYYLTADITLTADNYNTKKLEGVYIHGNGKTITLQDAAICQNAKNLTVRWLNIAGSVDTAKWGKTWCSPFGIYNDKTGWAIFENVKSSVNVDYSWNSNRYQSVSGVFHVANAGSRFVNVEYSGTITTKGYAFLDYIGAIVANATDTTFTNCTVSGNLRLSTVLKTVMMADDGTYPVDGDGNSLTNGADVEIGNFCGKANGCTFTDCTNDGYIYFSGTSRGSGKKANANHNYGASYAYVGGFVGFNGDKDATTDKKTTFTRCTNTAKADIYLEGNCGGVGNAGGFVGYSRMASVEMTDCTNSGDVLANAEGAWWLGGLIGMWDHVTAGKFTASIVLDGCANNGEIRGFNNGKTNDSFNGWGGIAGYIYNCYDTTQVSATITNCTNTGDITAKEGSTAFKSMRGGIVGQMVSMHTVRFEKCVNTGDVLAPAGYAPGGAYGTGGILGGIRCYGDQWTKAKVGTFTFKDCINAGDISGKQVAGILGGAGEEVVLGDGVALNLNFEGCTNAGDITDVIGTNAAGILANVKGWNVNIKNCNNGGTIKSEACAGGIVASAGATGQNTAGGSLEGTFTIDTAVNYGTIGYKDAAKGKQTGTAGGIGGAIGLTSATIKNSINIGNIIASNTDALAVTTFSAQSTGNKYLVMDGIYSDNGSELATRALADAAAEATGLRACNYMTMYKLAVEYSTNSDKYTYDGNKTWANILALCATVKTEIENGMKSIFSYSQATANDTYDKFMAEASLIRVKPDLEPLKAEIETGLAKRDNGTVWTVNTLKRFNDALEVANALVALGDKADAQEVIDATAALKQATNSLRRDPTGGSGNNNNDNTNDDTNNDNTNDENNNDNTNDDNTNDENTNNDNTNDENTDNGGENVQPGQTEAPTTAPTEASTNKAEDEGGCGSVIGGAAIAVTAILALGAGVALKKKED